MNRPAGARRLHALLRRHYGGSRGIVDLHAILPDTPCMMTHTTILDTVTGDATALAFPAHPRALVEAGADFLTRAFQAFGSLPPDNRVTRIVSAAPCPGGSTGQKLFLTVAYLHPGPGLHTDLFVKFSRDFTDATRDDRGKYEMAAEVHIAEMSRLPAFPVAVPHVYFADYHAASHTGLMITRSIPFGSEGIEPHHPKCMDHEIAAPHEHYRVIVTALARIAGAHRAGRLSPAAETLFPYDRAQAVESVRIRRSGAQLRQDIADYAEFAAAHPQLVPDHLRTPGFLAKLERQGLRFHAHQDEVARFLQSDPQLIALCHWNANIDNAWFWRDGDGALQCGLLDWGHAGQMNLAFALWGSLSAAHHDVWRSHFGHLVDTFLGTLAEHGGPRIPKDGLHLHVLAYAGLMGLGYFLESPARILQRFPDVAAATGPQDPVFRGQDTARNQLHILTVFLELWFRNDFDAALDRILAVAPPSHEVRR